MEEKADTPTTEENKSSTYETMQEHAWRSIALRTVPVILRHRERCLQVNCFLDKGSDTSYPVRGCRRETGVGWQEGKSNYQCCYLSESQYNVSNHRDWLGESGWSGGYNHCSENISLITSVVG